MMLKQMTMAAAAFSAVAMVPTAAEAGQRHRGYSNDYGYSQHYRGDRYRNERRYYGRNDRRNCKSGTTAAIIGGAGGALLGREVAGRRNRTTGTILGAAIGALAGREITRTC